MLIDRGTIKAVREILDRFDSVAMNKFKKVNRMKRDHFALSPRGGPDDFVKVGVLQDIYEESMQQVRSIIRELSEISRESVDMGEVIEVIADVAALDTVLQQKLPDVYASGGGKLSPVALAVKVIENMPTPAKPGKKK